MHESSTKETKWVCIQLACSRRPRAFEEAHCCNIQAKFYNEKFPLVYESDNIWDSLSWRSWLVLIWSTSVEKRIVVLPLFIFIFWAFFLWPFLGQYSMNDDHHTSICLQLNDYNSILEQSMTLYECLRRYTGITMNQEWHVWKIMHGGLATNTMPTTWSCKAIWQWWCVS